MLPQVSRIFRGSKSFLQWQFCHPASGFITDADLGYSKHIANIRIWLIVLVDISTDL